MTLATLYETTIRDNASLLQPIRAQDQVKGVKVRVALRSLSVHGFTMSLLVCVFVIRCSLRTGRGGWKIVYCVIPLSSVSHVV